MLRPGGRLAGRADLDREVGRRDEQVFHFSGWASRDPVPSSSRRKTRFPAGEKVSAHDILDAQLKRGALGTHMNLFHRNYDLLVTPTLSIPAFDAGKEVADRMLQSRWTDWTPFTFPFNLTQQPAASVPCGFTAAGLPIGLQIVGPRYGDALVLRAARAYEAAQPQPTLAPSAR